jgi:taurine-pyruvate aminotransferase
VELVADRATREPLPERQVAAVVAAAMKRGVQIGMTNRSLPGLNNTLVLAPALVITADQVDQIAEAIDGALHEVCGAG